MNNNKLIILLGPIIAIIVFIGIVAYFVPPAISDYNSAKEQAVQTEQNLQIAEAELNKSEATRAKEEDLLKNIKSIFQASSTSSSDNLSMFGTMFDDVIQRIQQNGLMIRAIEYQMTPENDPLSVNFSKDYNVCALKFFLVGSYSQVKTLLNELQTSFPYLLGLSNMNVLVYEDNTDYVLVDLTVNLYSKKPDKR